MDSFEEFLYELGKHLESITELEDGTKLWFDRDKDLRIETSGGYIAHRSLNELFTYLKVAKEAGLF